MTQITSTQGTPGTTLAPHGTAGSTVPNPSSALGQNDFLKLMMVQLQHQDPLNPGDPTQYLSELAQFTQVEQATNTAESTAKTATEQSTASALALLGHTVTYTDPKTGQVSTGAVQKVQMTSAGPTLTVAGITGIAPASVTEVS